MNKILTELSNPVWWFSVVIAGIAINVFSSYLKGTLDKFFSDISSSWRNISLARKKAWEERVVRISSSNDDKKDAIAEELRNRLKSIFLLLLAVITFLYGERICYHYDELLVIFLVFSSFFSLFSIRAWKDEGGY